MREIRNRLEALLAHRFGDSPNAESPLGFAAGRQIFTPKPMPPRDWRRPAKPALPSRIFSGEPPLTLTQAFDQDFWPEEPGMAGA